MESENKDVIHVVLAFYDPKGTYSQHAGVAMVSIFERTKRSVCVHILHDETLTEHNRSFLSETAESFNQQVAFHDVSPYMSQLEDIIPRLPMGQVTIGTLFRMAIQDVLPLEKVIYLDCDVVVNMDIQEFWDVPLEGNSIAGVLDVNRSRFSLRMRLMGCDWKTYINNGVLLMDLSRIREIFNIRKGVSWLTRYWIYVKHPGQDWMNACFRGDIKILGCRFNNLNGKYHDVADSILHLTVKPWEDPKNSAAGLYWRAFLKTPWGRLSSEEVAYMMIDIFQKAPSTHRRTAQCYRKIFHRLWTDVFSNTAVRATGLVKFLYYETKFFFTRGK